VKLLFDQNLSHRLVAKLADVYPDSAHVQTLGLDYALDEKVWDHARQEGYAIVTKDADFHERSILSGFPPKVIWICRGNCSTREIETILRQNHAQIQSFEADNNLGVFILV
jgi:predicted nuclease of predicted toxin-antitoxin system